MLVVVLASRRRSRWKICGVYLRTLGLTGLVSVWLPGFVCHTGRVSYEASKTKHWGSFQTNVSQECFKWLPLASGNHFVFWFNIIFGVVTTFSSIFNMSMFFLQAKDVGMVGAARNFQQSHKSSGKQVRRHDDLPWFAETVGGVFTCFHSQAGLWISMGLWVKVFRAAWALRMIGWRPDAENLPYRVGIEGI